GEVDVAGVDGLSVHLDVAALDGLEAVDAADERALARNRRPADHDARARLPRQADVGEDVERPEPLVDARELDGGGHRYSITSSTSPGFTAWHRTTRLSLNC